MKVKTILLAVLLPLIISCAPATGVGEFPALSLEGTGGADLALLPVRGEVDNQIKYRLVNNLKLETIRERFRSVNILADDTLAELEIPQSGQLTGDHLDRVSEQTGADYLLEISIEEFGEEHFTDRDRETLYYYRTRMERRTYYGDGNSDTGPSGGPGRRVGPPGDEENNGDSDRYDRDIYEKIYGREEIPVDVDRVRVVMVVSARIHQLVDGQVVWSGRRLERAEGDLARTSPVELTERVLGRIGARLSRGLVAVN